MKNIFDYAKKELSQDAFLRWLFENYDCELPKVRKAAYLLLNLFTGLNADSEDRTISELTTAAQYQNMDVLIRFTYKETVHVIVIEDKTFSSEHAQLSVYNETLASAKFLADFGAAAENIHRIFYKTDLANPFDKHACKENEWNFYFIEDILPLFERFFLENGEDTGSHILNDYIRRLRTVYAEVAVLPDIPMNKWSKMNFRTFMHQKIITPFMEQKLIPALTINHLYVVEDHYDDCTLAFRYFLSSGGQDYCVSFLLKSNASKKAFKINLGLDRYPIWHAPHSQYAKNGRAPAAVEALVAGKLLERSDLFRHITGRSEKHLTFASASTALQKQLCFENGPDALAAVIQSTMRAFWAQCGMLAL